VEAPAIRRSGVVLAVVAALGMGFFMLGPDYLRYGAALIATPWKKASEVAPYSISVEPGNATVPRGTDLQVSAQLNGFNSELVEVVTRRGADSQWERIPMGLGSDTVRFSARLFDLDADLGPFESPLPTGWSGDGQEDQFGSRLDAADLEAAGQPRLAERVRALEDAGIDARGWLPPKADAVSNPEVRVIRDSIRFDLPCRVTTRRAPPRPLLLRVAGGHGTR